MPGNRSVAKQEIACQQVLLHDSSVFSIQWTVLPARHAVTLTPQFLLERYLAHVRRFTLSLVRPTRTGRGYEFRLLSTSASLISFAGPVCAVEGNCHSVTLRICGGILVQPELCERGLLTFLAETVSDGVRITLRLSGYCPLLLGGRTPPLWRKWVYRVSQAAIHKMVTIRFLARLYRELEGPGRCLRVVRASVLSGEEI